MKSSASLAEPIASVHSRNMQMGLKNLVAHARRDIEHVSEPGLQALLETTAEVLGGFQTAFKHYDQGEEKAWRR